MNKLNLATDIAIIGAGLTGLTLAYLLRNSGKSITIIEARNRLGGRIWTKGYDSNQPVEMGATWLGSQHQQLIALLQELNIPTFDQKISDTAIYEAISTSPHYLAKLPPNPNPSMRIQGGSAKLIHTLANTLSTKDILLSQVITAITESEQGVDISTQNQNIKAKVVVSTLPPNLLTTTIAITPLLPHELIALTDATHTWMGESIKVALTYAKPFWREQKSSGTIMSNVGPISEMYDHSNYEDSFYSLKGFFNGNYFSVSADERLAMTLKQLQKYFGDKATQYLSYEETVWNKEKYTYTPYRDHVLPHQNNGHPLYQQTYMNGKLIIGGSETSAIYPGYMEGAVCNARYIAQKLQNDTT